MKVAVVFSALPAEGGGGHTFEASIRSGLREVAGESRHDFVLYAPGESQGEVLGIPQTRRESVRRIGRRRLFAAQDGFRAPRRAWRTWLQRSLDEQGVDFVWFASFYFEECEQPHAATVWDLAHLELPWFPEFGAAGQWERRQAYFERYLKRAARVLVPNAALTELLVSAFPVSRDRVVEIPFATPAWALDPVAADDQQVLRRHGINEPYLLYPAQFWAHKNHVTALKVLAELKRNGDSPTHLVLVGSDQGTEARVRATATALNLGGHVHFLGFVEKAELAALYRSAYALLYLSFLGPSNLPPLEAGAFGCPVICADNPGMRLQLEEAALFVHPTDVSAIVESVRAAGEPKTRAALVDSARELARGLTPAEYVRRVAKELDSFELAMASWRD